MKEARQALRVGTRLARRWDDYELTYKTATRDEFDMLWCYWRGQLYKEYQERRPRFLGFFSARVLFNHMWGQGNLMGFAFMPQTLSAWRWNTTKRHLIKERKQAKKSIEAWQVGFP